MLPFRPHSPSQVDQNTEASSEPTGSDATNKPSLRLLDPSDSNREETLVLHAGSELNPFTETAPLFIEGFDSDELPSRASAESSLPLQAIGIVRQGSPLQSLSEASGTGNVFSVSTDYQSSLGREPQRRHGRQTQEHAQSEAEGTNTPDYPFAHKLEFLWTDGKLCYGNEPLHLPPSFSGTDFSPCGSIESSSLSTTSSTSPATVVNVLDLNDGAMDHFLLGGLHLGASHLIETSDSELDLEFLSHDLDAALRDQIIEKSAIPVSIIRNSAPLQEAIEEAFEFVLDEIFRQHPPTETRDTRARQSGSQSRQTRGRGVRKPSASNGQPLRQRQPKKRSDDPDENSDGEPSEERGGVATSQNQRRKRLFACPYLHWRRDTYKSTCLVEITKISYLKIHMRRHHEELYCERCYVRFGDMDSMNAHSRNTIKCLAKPFKDIPEDLLTREKWKEINCRETEKLSHCDQWRRIYRILFPDDNVLHTPYLCDDDVLVVMMMQKAMRSSVIRKIFNERVGNEAIFEYVCEKWIAEACAIFSAWSAQAALPGNIDAGGHDGSLGQVIEQHSNIPISADVGDDMMALTLQPGGSQMSQEQDFSYDWLLGNNFDL